MTLYEEIQKAIEDNTNKEFPDTCTVAVQGVEGAYQQQACDKFFKNPTIRYYDKWEKVCASIENGICQYGILPIENSTTGSIRQIYDLMVSHNFKIVRTTRLKINHSLLTKKGVELKDIKEIFSHEQGIEQCQAFLDTMRGVKLTKVANTATAAKMVAESDRNDIAAISSINCATLYDLKILKAGVQDKDNNYTRFICISKNLEIYPGADRTSLMLVLKNRPGELFRTLAKFDALGINLTKLESRPLQDRDFEYMFYFDLDTSVYSKQFTDLICQLEDDCTEFKYLGSYTEKA